MLKTGIGGADNHRVSLFDSLYGEQPGEPDAPGAEPNQPDHLGANAMAATSALTVDAPPTEPAAIEIPPIEIASDASPFGLDDPAPSGPEPSAPGPIAFEAPAMSLQDFATEVFGTRNEVTPASSEASAFAVTAAAGEGNGDVPESSFAALSALAPQLDAPDALGTAAGPAGADLLSAFAVAPLTTDPAPDASPFASDASPFSPDVTAPGLLPGGVSPQGNDGGSIDDSATFGAISPIDDDLLPARKPKRGLALPTRGAGTSADAPTVSGGLAQRAKMAGLVVLALASGFFGYRTFAPGGSGGSDGGAQTASLAGPPSAPQPDAAAPSGLGAPLGAIEPAQLAAAEVELRNVGLEAQAHFAETGTYALDATAWDQVIGAQVVAVGSPVAQGAFQVVADQDAACFQTATAGGASVAIGVTGQGLTFASDAAGASICNADASVLTGWATSLATAAG